MHANTRGRFGRTCATPVGFETQSIVEAVAPQRLKLSNPTHDASAYRSPIVFVVGLAHHIFAVTVPNAVFGQQLITGWIWSASEGSGIPGIPVQHEVFVWNRLRPSSRLFSACGVAGHLVFEQEDEVIFGAAFRSLLQFGIDRRPVRLRIVQAPV